MGKFENELFKLSYFSINYLFWKLSNFVIFKFAN